MTWSFAGDNLIWFTPGVRFEPKPVPELWKVRMVPGRLAAIRAPSRSYGNIGYRFADRLVPEQDPAAREQSHGMGL